MPEKIPSDQHALFREVLESFENSGKQYAVAGAFALQKHTGIFRSTKDPDIFMSPQAARTALKDLKKAGFQERMEIEMDGPRQQPKAYRLTERRASGGHIP